MRARRVDNNHAAIARAFERMGCVVHRTNGDWDLTIRLGNAVELVEVKNPDTAYGRKGLNSRQEAMKIHRVVVTGMDDVERLVGVLRARQRAMFNGMGDRNEQKKLCALDCECVAYASKDAKERAANSGDVPGIAKGQRTGAGR